MTTKYSRGSLWRKWDLHVHTPSSIKQNYGPNSRETWDRFVNQLESLPVEFSVIGVNDYFFIDGYERLREYREHGRLKNLDTILPVVELRLAMFGGSGSKLSKVNYHVIFSEEVSPDTIRQQFIPDLKCRVKLRPARSGISKPDFDGVITHESIKELGEKIIDSVSEDKVADYGSPLHEGFSNLVFDVEAIKKALDKTYFRGKCLTAIGKTEWADVKWSTPVIAAKKSLINEADIVFTAAESQAAFKKAQDELHGANVNWRLLDCSDAHHWSESSEKDRIGNCDQWIKADPTFEGLRHAVHTDGAYGERAFMGGRPKKVMDVRGGGVRFIDRVEIRKRETSHLEEKWFDTKLEFNPGLVAIIGNRGNGKSALTDILGFLGGSKTEHYSFLSEEQFRRPPRVKASHYVGRLGWHSGDVLERGLEEDIPEEDVEKVRYIPQGYFEEVCNEIIRGETSEFEQEINRVVFSHIPEAKRLEAASLKELIELRTESRWRRAEQLQGELSGINRKIIDTEKRLTDEHRQELKSHLGARWDELAAHLRSGPESVEPPAEKSEVREKIEELREEKSKLEQKREELERELGEVEKRRNLLGRVRDRVEQFAANYRELVNELGSEVGDLDFQVEDIVLSLTLDLEPIEQVLEAITDRIGEIEKALDPTVDESIQSHIDDLAAEISEFTKGLKRAGKKFEEYQTELEDWESRQKEIVGRTDKVGTLRNLRRRLAELDTLPDRLEKLKSLRLNLTEDIYGELEAVSETYRDLHQPVHAFIEESDLITAEYALNFEVVLRDTGFADTFLSKIDQSVRGSFRGREEGREVLAELLEETDWETKESVAEFCRMVVGALHKDMRATDVQSREIDRQLVKGVDRQDVYDFVFGLEYLDPGYELRLGMTSIEHLSPGERGITLLIFYLLVSKDDRPLIIDQPEGNLDSQSVYQSLAPCIREARKKRQVFLVTHSPNLAVVCDAEQIIHASIKKESGYEVTYRTGAIENPGMNEVSVDILEGTPPAFLDRQGKYHSLRYHGN